MPAATKQCTINYAKLNKISFANPFAKFMNQFSRDKLKET